MGNHYLLNHSASWAAVCVSKNGCTSLKTRILMDHGIPTTDFATIHDRIGYDAKSRFLQPVAAGRPKGFHVFAVWRDPVARFLSVFKRFALAGDSGRHPESLPPEIDAWLDWVEDELRKPALRQDEHIRRQSDDYRPDDVDSKHRNDGRSKGLADGFRRFLEGLTEFLGFFRGPAALKQCRCCRPPHLPDLRMIPRSREAGRLTSMTRGFSAAAGGRSTRLWNNSRGIARRAAGFC
jgi:hypothetical protein